jgi:hypothetical protein
MYEAELLCCYDGLYHCDLQHRLNARLDEQTIPCLSFPDDSQGREHIVSSQMQMCRDSAGRGKLTMYSLQTCSD